MSILHFERHAADNVHFLCFDVWLSCGNRLLTVVLESMSDMQLSMSNLCFEVWLFSYRLPRIVLQEAGWYSPDDSATQIRYSVLLGYKELSNTLRHHRMLLNTLRHYLMPFIALRHYQIIRVFFSIQITVHHRLTLGRHCAIVRLTLARHCAPSSYTGQTLRHRGYP